MSIGGVFRYTVLCMSETNTSVYVYTDERGEHLSAERAACHACEREGWLGDFPGQGGIVTDERGELPCDDCAEAVTETIDDDTWQIRQDRCTVSVRLIRGGCLDDGEIGSWEQIPHELPEGDWPAIMACVRDVVRES